MFTSIGSLSTLGNLPIDTTVCTGSNERFSDAEIQAAVRGLLTAGAVWAAGLDDAARAHWWQAGGEFYQPMQAAGAVAGL